MSDIDLDKFICSLYEYGRIYKYFEDAIPLALKDQGLMMKDAQIVKNIEQKFKVGDWVVRKDGTSFGSKNHHLAQIIDVTINEKNCKYIYWISKDGCNWTYICDYIDDFRTWTIEDAKDGDVLAFPDGSLVMFRNMITDNRCFCYAILNDNLLLMQSHNTEGACPATNEQRDILFKKMKEEGYELDRLI